MKGSKMFVMLSALLVICFGVALAENGNMTKPMEMAMGIPMGTPMNLSGGSSTNVIVLNNVTLNLILAQNLTEVNTIVLPSMINETK
jgi:hypothetical protein